MANDPLRTLTCLEGAPRDALVAEIERDLAGKSSILAMLQEYMAQLRGDLDNEAPPYRKLARLFELGATPDVIEGHHYGVAIGLRTGDLGGSPAGDEPIVTAFGFASMLHRKLPRGLAEYGNVLGYLWGTLVGGVAPWVGKSFAPMTPDDRARVLGDTLPADVPVWRGVNHFNVIEHAPVNVAANAVLGFLWHLRDAPAEERARWGHEKDGGHLACYRARSIYHGTPREVMRLSYRYAALDNHPPLNWLVDELVRIADGLYLGQVVFATDRLLHRFDPVADPATYRYQHFGYFVVFDDRWNAEARALFPHLGMPPAAAAATRGAEPPRSEPVQPPPAKFIDLTLVPGSEAGPDAALLSEIRTEIGLRAGILQTLKAWSEQLDREHDTRAAPFAKLHALFVNGIAPSTMSGFWRGARLTFQSQGFLAAFHVNTLNVAWQALRWFSPWTGKRFDPIDRARLLEITGGRDPGDAPVAFGSNTVVFRSARERFIEGVIKLVGAPTEPASDEERRRSGYDARCFFFLGSAGRSIVPENEGKTVYQFNYRWKPLRTPPPDDHCVDEIVQIADGLYLGKLIYATNLLEPWDPEVDPPEYRYRLFGYFLLMDEEWHALRLRLGLDPYDT